MARLAASGSAWTRPPLNGEKLLIKTALSIWLTRLARRRLFGCLGSKEFPKKHKTRRFWLVPETILGFRLER